MDLPIELKNKIENLANGYKLSELKDISKKMSERYTYASGQGNVLVASNKEVMVYAIVRMPATYSSVYKVIESTLEFFHDGINSVLDIGAGTGAATWAISNFLPQGVEYTLIEREENMINLGMSLMKDDKKLSAASWIQADFSKERITKKADLVIASYALNELSGENRNRVIDELYDLANKLIIVIEPGTQIAFSQLKTLRNKLIYEGGSVVAPCPHSSTCENEWCHFATRVGRSKLHKQIKDADVPFEDEKFSYFAISKTENDHCENRILRHPLILNGNVVLETCSLSGVGTVRVLKKDKELFKKAKKSSWGDAL